ncbi:MAG: exodeoxyribonuclease VII large subunit [Firmicutes bacterium]|nr:exodeoxyribonuclease VII large subunit [Bacillota bacterium]
MALKPIKVSQLNKYIGRVLSTDPILGNVCVTGEISNLKYHNMGYIFFTLKDENSKISCFVSAAAAENLRYELSDGMEIIVYGYVSVYERGGYYSLNVSDVQISGEGNLNAAYRALYDKLLKEGIFDADKKKPIPAFPKKVCIVTSETGAAVKDILKITRSRNDVVNIMVYPCLVQGERAAAEIASAISDINLRFKDTDLIITGRGGGSLEELWAFNEEIVARSIFASDIPVISAVGHETDFCISDYAADMRAETPTAAAMMLPDTFALRAYTEDIVRNMKKSMGRVILMKENSLKRYDGAVFRSVIKNRIDTKDYRLKLIYAGVKNDIKLRVESMAGRVENIMLMLEAANPEKILNRGYAIVSDGNTGRIIQSMEDAKGINKINLRFKDGELSLLVEESGV